jgi:hypothetical protein
LLQQETQQQIQTRNKRVNTVDDSVNEKLNMLMPETTQVQEKIRTESESKTKTISSELTVHKTKGESSTDNIRK